MARLPSGASLGGMPDAQYSRPIASVDTTALTNGVKELGRGVSNLGTGLYNAGKEMDRKAASLDEARATSAYITGRVKNDAELPNLTEQEAIEKHKQLYNENLTAAAGFIKDPAAREKFMLRYQPDVARAHVSADGRWKTVDRDRTLATANATYEDLISSAPKASPELRSAALSTIGDTITGMVQGGYITEVQAQGLRKKMAEKYGEAVLTSLPAAQRVVALSMPQGMAGTDMDQAKALLRAREGFKGTTYWDVNAHRLGYGSDTITDVNGNVRRVKQGDAVTREDAERDLARRTRDSMLQVKAAIGDEAFAKLTPGARAALASVTYNYGSPPSRIIGAAKTGDSNAVADAIERLQGDNNGVNRQRRLIEAAIARGGNVPGANMAPVISEDRRRDLIAGAQRELNLKSQEDRIAEANERASVKQLMDDDHASILTTGQPIGDLTPERVGQVYGPVAQEQFLQQREQAQKYHDATHDWDHVPVSEIADRVELLKPTPGAKGFASQQKYYQQAQKAAAAIAKQREADPAAAADKFDDVAAARKAVNISDPQSVAALAKARLKAQEVLGIPESARMPVTKQEAAAIGKPIFDATEGAGTLQAIRTILPFLDKAYGKDADKVLEFALTQAGLDDKVAKQAHAMMRRLQRGEPLTPQDAAALRTQETNAAQAQAAGAPRQPVPYRAPGQFLTYPDTTRQPPPSQPEQSAPKQTRTIPAAAIAELRRNPQMVDAFMKKYGTDDYGKGYAAKAAEALGIKVRKE